VPKAKQHISYKNASRILCLSRDNYKQQRQYAYKITLRRVRVIFLPPRLS